MFHQELNIDTSDFHKIIRDNKYDLIPSFLSIGMKLDDGLTLKGILLDAYITKKNFYEILLAVKKYQPDIVDNDLASILLSNVIYTESFISVEIIKILLDFGADLEINYINDINKKIEINKKVLDFLKSY